MRTPAVMLVVASLFVAPPLAAKDDKPPEVDSPARVKPGQTALLKSAKGMRYFLRVPKDYQAKTGARLVVFMHGSNMNGLMYVRSYEGKRWANDDILVCPNGESGTDPFGQNNFTPDSAPFVHEITEDVKKAFKTTVTYLGGHSQGGYLTYNVAMLGPELYQGALPMAADCWSQNEPNLWEDQPETAAKQRAIPFAIVHGKNDPIVPFEQGQHAFDVFRGAGWQKLRFLTPEKAEHKFQLYPVDEALDWLDAMNGRNEERTSKSIDKWAKDGEWGWVLAAAKAMKAPSSKWIKAAEDAAAKASPAMTEAFKGKPSDWIPKWIEFWRVHGGADAAKPLVEDYLKKRADQREVGARLFNEALGLIRADKRPEAKPLLERILVDAPCSHHAHDAVKWLADWK
jgi:predicted esterase